MDETKQANVGYQGNPSPQFLTSRGTTDMAAPVLREYNDLGASIGFLSEVIDTLRIRLEPILGQSMAEETGNMGVPEQSLCPLGSSIRSDRKRIDALREQLHGILNRIEV